MTSASLLLLLALRQGVDPLDGLVATTTGLFQEKAAFETVAFADGFFRDRGNEGFNRVLDHLGTRLRAAGFGEGGSFRVYEFTDGKDSVAWTPRRARLELLEPERKMLQAFEKPGDAERTMLCIRSFSTPPGGVTAEVVDAEAKWDPSLDAADLEGKLVLTDAGPGGTFRRARGAAGVLSASIEDYNLPEEFPDAIQFGSIPYDEARRGFGMMVSRRTRDLLRSHLAAGKRVVVRAEAEVDFTKGSLRTLVAEVRGTERPDEIVAFSAHVQEPGANDNASGVGCALEIARAFKRGIDSGALPRPLRTTAFLWGQEIESTRLFLDRAKKEGRRIVAGIALDMVGEKTEVTRGPFRIERQPDPGAVWVRPPDAHTEWGSGLVDRFALWGHYLNDLFRAVCDARARIDGWVVEENPFEGGSDHAPFLDAGIPALLAWHFTDVFYHTSLDRLERVDPREIARVGSACLAAAVALTGCFSTDFADRMEAVLEARAEARFASLAEGASRAIEAVPIDRKEALAEEETKAVRAWGKWFDEADRRLHEEALPCGEASPRCSREEVARAARRALERLGSR